MDELSQWIRDIFIIILSLSFLEIILPDSSMNKYLKFIFSIIILSAILTPISLICNK